MKAEEEGWGVEGIRQGLNTHNQKKEARVSFG
jgi:hypothetical protein